MSITEKRFAVRVMKNGRTSTIPDRTGNFGDMVAMLTDALDKGFDVVVAVDDPTEKN